LTCIDYVTTIDPSKQFLFIVHALLYLIYIYILRIIRPRLCRVYLNWIICVRISRL